MFRMTNHRIRKQITDKQTKAGEMIENKIGSYSSYEVLTFPARKHSVHTYVGAKARPIAGKKAIPNPPQKLLYNMVLL